MRCRMDVHGGLARPGDLRHSLTTGSVAIFTARHVRSSEANSAMSAETIKASIATVHRRIIGDSGAHPMAPAASISHASYPTLNRACGSDPAAPHRARRNAHAPATVALRHRIHPSDTMSTTYR